MGAVHTSRKGCGSEGRKMCCHLNGATSAAAACAAVETAARSVPTMMTRRSKSSAANSARQHCTSVNLPRSKGAKRTPLRAVATTRLPEEPSPSSGATNVARRGSAVPGGCQGVDAETSAFGGGVGRAHKSVRYVVTCAFSGNDGFVLSGRAPVVSNSAGLARGQTCASSGSSASKKKANHGCLDKMHVTIGYRARSPGGRNRRQNPTVWLPSLSVSTNVYTDGFARVSGTSDVRLPGTYSGKQKCFSNATVTSGSSDAHLPIRRERPAEQQLGRGRARGVHGDAHAEERAGEQAGAGLTARRHRVRPVHTGQLREVQSLSTCLFGTQSDAISVFIRRPSSTTEKPPPITPRRARRAS